MKSLHVLNPPLPKSVGKEAISRFKSSGFYGSTISRVTGLTLGQVRYRLLKYGLVVPRAYARGESDQAKELIAQAKTMIAKIEAAKERAIAEARERHLVEAGGRHD